MPFPLGKILSLVLRQASRHVVTFVKNRAKNNETFRKILVTSAGWYHSGYTKIRMNSLGFGKVKEVRPLSDQAAIDLGSELIADIASIVCGISIFVFVESRLSKSKDQEEELKLEEIRSLKELLVYQTIQIEKLDSKMRELEQIMNTPTMYSKTSESVVAEYTDVDKDLSETSANR